MRNLMDNAVLGAVRRDEVRIGASSYKPCSDWRQLESDLGGLCWTACEIDNPFEAAFFVMAGVSYLQAFADGNKRVGRLTCNIPLLRAGLPPLSFMGVDKADYLTGLITFYELGDAHLLADVVSRGYAEAAPSYSAATASGRTPRSIEIAQRARIDESVRHLVSAAVQGSPENIDDYLGRAFENLKADDREVVVGSIRETLDALDDINCVAWGLLRKRLSGMPLSGTSRTRLGRSRDGNLLAKFMQA